MLYGVSQKVMIHLWFWSRPIARILTVEPYIYAEAVTMKQRKKSKYVYEGQYVAEVEVAVVEDDTGWSPYLSVEDAYKLDDVRDALRQGDLESAAKYGRNLRAPLGGAPIVASQVNQADGVAAYLHACVSGMAQSERIKSPHTR